MTGAELIAIRAACGMTQQDVADYLGLRHRSQVQHLETGRTAITGPKLELLLRLRETGGKSFSRKIQKSC